MRSMMSWLLNIFPTGIRTVSTPYERSIGDDGEKKQGAAAVSRTLFAVELIASDELSYIAYK